MSSIKCQHLHRKHNNDMSYLQWYVSIIHRLPSFLPRNFHIHIRILCARDCEWEALMRNSICLTMLVLKGRKERKQGCWWWWWECEELIETMNVFWIADSCEREREGRRSNLLKFNPTFSRLFWESCGIQKLTDMEYLLKASKKLRIIS